jgi:hypothetical protein
MLLKSNVVHLRDVNILGLNYSKDFIKYFKVLKMVVREVFDFLLDVEGNQGEPMLRVIPENRSKS